MLLPKLILAGTLFSRWFSFVRFFILLFICKLKDGWQGGGGNWWDQNKTTGGPKHKDDDRKIFVGGLAGEVGEHHLREHFKQFGDIELVEYILQFS